MPRFVGPLDAELAAEAAAGLAHAGRRLRRALDALAAFDAARRGRAGCDAEHRRHLVADAAEAYWGYVVQRELLGLQDAEYIGREYGVPPEVRLAMGPRVGRRSRRG
ncbi:MAG: hypothetical protein DIU71_03230 [Proteobacteria bacterium]|nr:MAG: hypothetical protein DIU71_03230 [Pseudomonadota bacterium]